MPKENLVHVRFEHHHDEWPDHQEGPFVWVETIGSVMFGAKNEDDEAEEIAALNEDGTWDAGPDEFDGQGKRKVRRYSRWTAFAS